MLHQGSRGFHVLLVLRGRLKVVRFEPSGARLLLAVREPGDLVGEVAVLDGQPRSASVITVGECEVSVVEAAEFLDILRCHNLADTIIRHTLARLREADDLRAELAELPVRRRVARLILRLTGDGDQVIADIAQEELAQAVGASRNAVVAELAALRRENVLKTGRRRLIVDDYAALRAIAAGTPLSAG